MNEPLKNISREIICNLFIFLFVYTGTSKILDHSIFETNLMRSPLISNYSGFVSWALPVVELITAVLLLLPSFKKIGLLISLALMILFTGYTCYLVFFAANVPCSCGGIIGTMTWVQHLFFNIAFTILAVIGLWWSPRNKFFIAINRGS